MTTDGLFDKIRNRIGDTPEAREAVDRKILNELNERLELQLANQAMTAPVLAQACSL